MNKNFFDEPPEPAREKGWEQVKLPGSSVEQTRPSETLSQGFEVARLDRIRSGLLMTQRETPLEKDFLPAQLSRKEHPWENERKGDKTLRRIGKKCTQ
ncbi:MAG: hypothetical protein ACYCOO_00770 [Chitinophagaceae bacterium]